MQIDGAPTVQPPISADESDGDQPRSSCAEKEGFNVMDDLEAQFQRRKKKELEQARMAGSNGTTAPQQVVRGASQGWTKRPLPLAGQAKIQENARSGYDGVKRRFC